MCSDLFWCHHRCFFLTAIITAITLVSSVTVIIIISTTITAILSIMNCHTYPILFDPISYFEM